MSLRLIFDAALGRAEPALTVPRHLPSPPKGRCVVIGTSAPGVFDANESIAITCDRPSSIERLSGLAPAVTAPSAPCDWRRRRNYAEKQALAESERKHPKRCLLRGALLSVDRAT